MIEISDKSHDDLLVVTASGKLTGDDYDNVFIPAMKSAIAQHGKIRLMMQLADDFKGWDLEAMWDDAKFGVQHRHDFSKVALVGGADWMKWCVKVAGHFMDGSAQTFDSGNVDKALEWIEG